MPNPQTNNDDDEWEKVPTPKAGTATATADDEWERVEPPSPKVEATEQTLPGSTPKLREAVNKGITPMTPPTKFEQERPPESEGLLSQGLGVVGRQLKDIAASTVAPYTKGYEAYQGAQKAGVGTLGSIGAGVGRGLLAAVPGDPYGQAESALHAPEEYKQRREAGYGPVYSALAPQAAGAVGVNLPRMEEEAAKGHMGGVAMEAAVPAGEALAGEATRIPAVKKAMQVPGKVADFVARGTPMTEAGKLEAAKSQAMVAAKPPSMNETEYTQRVSAAMPELQRVAQDNKGMIKTPRDADAAISKRIAQKEAPIAEQLATQTNPADLIHPEEYQNQVMQAVDQALNAETKSYRPGDIEKARKNVAELIGDQPRSQTKIEADRRTLNDESEKFYKANPTDQHGMLTSDALAVAQKAAADKIRELQYSPGGFFERAGIRAIDSEGQQIPLADFRRDVGNLIEVRNHFRNAIVKAETTGDWKPFGPLFKGPSVAAGGIGMVAGAAAGGPIGALFGTLAGEGAKAWGSYLTSKNPNLNTLKMFRNLEQTGAPTTTDIRTTPFPGGQGAVRGALAAPATEAGLNQQDTSGAVRGGRYTTPAGLLPGPVRGLLPGIGETGRGVEGLPLPGTAELAHPEMFPKQPVSGVPETTVQRGKGGRMARIYQGTSKPRIVGQTAEGGPIGEGEKVPSKVGNIEAGAPPEAPRPTRLGNIGEEGPKPPEVKHMVKPTETEETRAEAQKKSPNTTPVENLKVGDTFVDERGDPRRITEITEDGTIKTADHTMRDYESGKIQHLGEINSPQAQIARGGAFHPAPGEQPIGRMLPPRIPGEAPKFTEDNPESPLRSMVDPKAAEAAIGRSLKRKEGIGDPESKGLVLKGDDGKTYVYGNASTADLTKAWKSHLTPAEIKEWREWYPTIEKQFEESFGKGPEAAKKLLAWLASQQSVSPSGGMTNVLRGEDVLSGQPKIKKAGLAEANIMSILQGEIPKGGLGAKLMDFVDSALGKKTRTFMGDDPRGGAPAVIDVHGARGVGFVDKTLKNAVAEKFGKAEANKLTVDMLDAPSETQYEYGSKKFNEMANELNRKKFDGGGWTPSQVQAVDWARMIKQAGREPELPRDIFTKNIRNISYEVGFSPDAPYSKTFPEYKGLPYEQRDLVTHAVATKAMDIAQKEAGGHIAGNTFGPGGWMGEVSPSVQTQVLASPEAAERAANILGYLLQQDAVLTSRPLQSGSGHFFQITEHGGKVLTNYESVLKFWNNFREIYPKAEGFMPVRTAEGPGIQILKLNGHFGPKEVQALEYAATKAAEHSKMEAIETKHGPADVRLASNDWKVNKNGEGYTQRAGEIGRPGLQDRLHNQHRPAVEQAIREALKGQRETAKSSKE